ncbi:MAG: FAD-binding oxidoreductase [Vicinamibacterales bacterium]
MRADVVIVGAGIYGLATAWTLATRGASVLVLEADAVAAGASGGLGKRGVRANGRDLRELPLMREAYELWPTLHETLGAPTGYERVGHLQLYERHHDIGQAETRARVQSALGIPTMHLEGERVRDLEPGVSSRTLGALHAPLDGIADHDATTRAYALAAQRAGATIRTGARVVDFVREGHQVVRVTLASGESVDVGRELLVLVNGSTGDLVARTCGCTLPVWTIYPQVVLSTPAPVAPFRSYVGHASRPVALKMVPSGAVMLSGGWRGRLNPETGRSETTQAHVAGNWAEAVALFPAIGELSIAEWTSDRSETNALDQIPIIDRVPGISNLLIGCGWTGHGWAIAPAVAPHLAAWALEGTAPDILKPFALARFPRLDATR